MITQVTSAAEVRELYPLLEKGCAELSKRSNEDEPYFAPDLYRSIIEGRYLLFVLHDDDCVWGWGTTYFNIDRLGEKIGICEDLYIQNGAPRRLRNEALDFFEKFCASEGCKSTVVMSPRDGWEKVLAPQGYRLVGHIYTKELKARG